MVGFMNTYSSNKRAAEGCLQGATQNKQRKREHNVAHRKEEEKKEKRMQAQKRDDVGV